MVREPEAAKEPEFMKYMKGVNINFDDKAYMQQHFEEEEGNVGISQAISDAAPERQPLTHVPDEFRGVRVELLEQNIRRLELDMEAEIQTIKLRYQEKINYMQEVVRLAKQTRKSQDWQVEQQTIDDSQSLFMTSEVTDDLLPTNSPDSVIRRQDAPQSNQGMNSMKSVVWTGPAV